MNYSATHADDADATMTMVDALRDGSVAGFATYHLLKTQLLEIRGLPETRHPQAETLHRGGHDHV
ncbi:MAG: hypothetical protein JO243_11480 [Solirubrobacterales bacterium]|nr:hypothetical protein [Solirubrobacterales bacterium]